MCAFVFSNLYGAEGHSQNLRNSKSLTHTVQKDNFSESYSEFEIWMG